MPVKRSKRYVITAAQNATPIHKPFFETLLGYCKHNNAELIVIPFLYRNPTSLWSQAAEHDSWWAPELGQYLTDERINLNKNLVALADISTQPTAERPLRGMETISRGMSAIIGHTKIELKSVPAPQHKLPKLLVSTGAVTLKNYVPSKAGKKGEFHHTWGATVAEIDNDTFHLRQLNSIKDGSFCDLDYQYKGNQREKIQVEALVLGDSHVEFIDPSVVEATFGAKGIIPTLKPKIVVYHDVWDFYCRSHWHKNDPFINLVKHNTGKGNVEKSLREVFAFIDKVTPEGTTNVFVPSNHPDHFSRWVKETDPRTDPENLMFWAETFLMMAKGSHITAIGAATPDPFAFWGRKWLKCTT